MSLRNLLAELRARGIELEASGDRLRFRPAHRVPEDLLQHIKEHKAEIMAILAGVPSIAPVPDLVHSAVTETAPGPINADGPVTCTVEMGSLVPVGWSVQGWVRYMRQLAEACGSFHPEQAAKYLAIVDEIEGRGLHGTQ